MTAWQANRWKGAVTGVAGGAAGLLAMRYYWQNIAPLVTRQADKLYSNNGEQNKNGTDAYPEALQLDSIALFGEQYRDKESSTAALGRLIFQWLTGSEPQSQQTKTLLSYLVHWAYGLFQGAVYGITRSDAPFPDLNGGIRHAVKLWLYGDELMVPMLGLQSGPTAVPPQQHLNRLGAHLFYGIATATLTHLFRRLL